MTPQIQLRDVIPGDLPHFFDHQREPDANEMAAFTAPDPTDEAAFMSRWQRILNDDTITKQTILAGESVAGHILQFEQFGKPSVSYWLGKAFWGKGIATQALTLFLKDFTTRPLYARAAKDNLGSIRVLEKCGFVISSSERGFANARGTEIDEVILMLK